MAKKKLMPAADWREERTRKFQILVSADFTCAYCGCRPGSEHLHVDHLVPVSRGGSDNIENLCCACETCNSRKSNAIIFPSSMVIGVDNDGFRIHRRFGTWAVMFDETRLVMERIGWGYWFEAERLYEFRFITHLEEKSWDCETWCDFCECADYVRCLVCDPSQNQKTGRRK
jgi:hypothetical protein